MGSAPAVINVNVGNLMMAYFRPVRNENISLEVNLCTCCGTSGKKMTGYKTESSYIGADSFPS